MKLRNTDKPDRLVTTNKEGNTMMENITAIANTLIASGSLVVSYLVYRENKKSSDK